GHLDSERDPALAGLAGSGGPRRHDRVPGGLGGLSLLGRSSRRPAAHEFHRHAGPATAGTAIGVPGLVLPLAAAGARILGWLPVPQGPRCPRAPGVSVRTDPRSRRVLGFLPGRPAVEIAAVV